MKSWMARSTPSGSPWPSTSARKANQIQPIASNITASKASDTDSRRCGSNNAIE